MFCGNCGKEIKDGAKFCPVCGTPTGEAGSPVIIQTQPEIQPQMQPQLQPQMQPQVQPQVQPEPIPVEKPKKKKKGLIILVCILSALLLIGGVVAALLFTPFPGTPKHMMNAIRNTVNKKNCVIDIKQETKWKEEDDSYTNEASLFVDLENAEYVSKAPVDGETYAQAYGDGNLYYCYYGDNRYPRGYLREDVADHDDVLVYKDDAIKVINLITRNKEVLLDDLEGKKDYEDYLEKLSEKTALDFSPEDVEEALNVYIPLVNDKEWLEENAGFEASKDGNAWVYTFTPDTYELCVALLDELDKTEFDDMASDLKDQMEKNKEYIDKIELTLSIRVTGGTIESIEFVYDNDYTTSTVTCTFSDYNNTEVDVEEIADKLEETHEGRSTCKNDEYSEDCGKVYFKGYCYSCASDIYCENFCGNKQYKDGYCRDCFTPCKGCEDRHGYEYNDGYCYSCRD